MSGSATSSSALRPGAVAGLLTALSLAPALAGARVFLSVDEALALAFPGCAVERGTIYLTEAEKARAAELAGEPPGSAIVHPYAARCEGGAGGTAYFDVHRVRTLEETLMVVVDPAGEVARVEVLSFDEPPDYKPRDAWYAQFRDRGLDAELRLDGAIRPVTGATLTATATTSAVRRVLAVHTVIHQAATAPEPR